MSIYSFNYKFLFSIYIANLFIVALSYAQPSNYEFYPHDYAKSPLENSESIGQSESSNNKSNTVPGKKFTAKPDDKSILEIQGRKIESLGLITSGLDYVSLDKEMRELLDIFNNKSIRPSMVAMIGENADPRPKEVKDIQHRLSSLGVNFSFLIEAPQNFKITTVPAWIITLKEGDIVLEGVDSPNKYINSKGEFMDPDQVGGPEI